MEKIIFNKITRKVFLEYGFTKVRNKYILLLNDVTIVVGFCSWRGVKSFNYYFFLNSLYDSHIEFNDKYDTLVDIKMEHSPFLQGYHKHEILFEKYTEDEYEEMLSKMLRTYFDPYKENALQFLRDNAHNMCLRKEAKEFLKLI